MIRECVEDDFEVIYEIINDAAQAYRGIIPPDRWHDPYMPREELREEISAGVAFLGYEKGGELAGVMGHPRRSGRDADPVTPTCALCIATRASAGETLDPRSLMEQPLPVLIGTWADAVWGGPFL